MPMKQCQLRGFPKWIFRCDSNSLHIGGLNPQPFWCELFAITTRLNFIVDIPIIIISYHIITDQWHKWFNTIFEFHIVPIKNTRLHENENVYLASKAWISLPESKKNCCFVFFVSLRRFVRLFHTQKVF